jgi:biopolymer transport protein ExbB/TolQ
MVERMRASDIQSWVGTFGLAVTIVIVLIVTILAFTPKIWEQYKKQKEREQDQMDRLMNMQDEHLKTVTAALERSNVVIEANTKIVEMNAQTNEKTQQALTKCTDTISELSNKIEKNTDINQKVYTEVLILKDNVQNIKEKVS